MYFTRILVRFRSCNVTLPSSHFFFPKFVRWWKPSLLNYSLLFPPERGGPVLDPMAPLTNKGLGVQRHPWLKGFTVERRRVSEEGDRGSVFRTPHVYQWCGKRGEKMDESLSSPRRDKEREDTTFPRTGTTDTRSPTPTRHRDYGLTQIKFSSHSCSGGRTFGFETNDWI